MEEMEMEIEIIMTYAKEHNMTFDEAKEAMERYEESDERHYYLSGDPWDC